MKKFAFMILGVLFLTPLFLFAQEVATQPQPLIDQPTSDFLKMLIDSLGGLKGASSLAIAGVVVQILIKALNLPIVGKFFSEAQGWLKLLIVTGLSLVSGVIALMSEGGLTLSAALVHSTTLAALMVFANQLIQHFFPPKT